MADQKRGAQSHRERNRGQPEALIKSFLSSSLLK